MSAPRRLGIFTPATARGGSEEFVIAVARRASAVYSTVSVYLPDVADVGSVREDLAEAGIPVGTLDVPYAPPFSEPEHIAAFETAWRILDRERFDDLLIVLPGIEFGGALIDAAASFDQPTVVLYQLAGYDHYLSSVERQFYTWARRRRQTWLTVSADNRDRLCRNLGWDRSAIEVFPNGLLHELTPLSAQQLHASRLALRAELGIPADAKVCLTVARLDPQKGVNRLLDAAAIASLEQPSLHFVWAGDGRLDAEAGAGITARGLEGRVHLLGRRRDVGTLLGAADLYTLPSHFEGRPFAVMEAMTSGLPCVLSDIGPHRDLAAGGAAALVDADDAPAYAALLCSVASDERRAQTLGRAASAAAAAFSAGDYYSKLFARLMATADTERCTPEHWPLLQAQTRERVAIFGTGEGGRRALEELRPFADVTTFVDGREHHEEQTFAGRPVVSPVSLDARTVDRILLASCWYGSMRAQLIGAGLPDDRIDIFPQWRLGLPRQNQRRRRPAA